MISDFGVNGSHLDVTFGTYREVSARARSFEALGVMKPWQPTLTGSAEPERLDGQRVSAKYFRALGVMPAIGREFLEAPKRCGDPAATEGERRTEARHMVALARMGEQRLAPSVAFGRLVHQREALR